MNTTKWEEVYLALGSNLGDKEQNLSDAIRFLDESNRIRILATSSIYETLPIGPADQDNFWNLCIKAETTLSPRKLLSKCQRVEKRLKRKREIFWGPRTIDVDIIYFGNLKIRNKHLTIPHNEILNRDFVYVPLLEIDSQLLHNGVRLSKLINKDEELTIKRNLGRPELRKGQ
ncbi:MAG: 2-amino-4-hydroxy-6-hydroxymethyldihydropteridine diphosphokinase [Spirochaetales bacterium]|nr:2-amino-4-hydroxy-6-hydroxymethyldihydropteridine diphosphokinase [Spirochaetales bacterium]